MAADRALAEDDHAAREDVRALDRDRDRRAFPGAADVVARPEDDALSAVHVHRVAHHFAAGLGGVVLRDRGRHGRLLAAIDRVRGHLRERRDRVRVTADARERFLDAFEATDGQLELLADSRVRARRRRAHLHAARRIRWQRDRAAHGQALDQHAPAMADVLGAADQCAERQEHVAAAQGAVLERHAQGHVAAADLEARRRARDQRERDAAVRRAAEQPFRIVQAERESHDRRDGRERDVALLEREFHAERFHAVVHPLADDAVIGDRRRVGARVGIGEREAGDLLAAREPRQVEVLLLLRAVVQQQFRRAERVRYGDRRAERARHARRLRQHAMVRVRRELQAAVALRDDHAEEAVLLQEFPGLGREVGAIVRDFPVVHHRAELFQRSVDERLFFGGQLRRGA